MIQREKIKSLIKSHYQMVRRLEKMLDDYKVELKKPTCESTKIIEVVYTHFFNNIEKALQIVKDKYGVTSNTFNLDTIMGFSNAHDHAAYRQALVREVNDLANLTLIQFSYEDLVKDVHV